MPELPEVDRVAKLIRKAGLGRVIASVETSEDKIVFADGITHNEFAQEITGRKIINVGRYGKVFYLELDGQGKHPVMHLGMTGNIHMRGHTPFAYQSSSKKSTGDSEWPPRFVKFIIKLVPPAFTDSTIPIVPLTELAFVDPRRLARIRLCASPLTSPPISQLGFDPILSMPPLASFTTLVLKRRMPIKALLLDQSFSAGVGNWVADEVLYQAFVHPEQGAHTLDEGQVRRLWDKVGEVCRVAVAVDADSTRFPSHWLFRHRWGKGKKTRSKAGLLLPSGEPATIKWTTVGGRTSAYVPELQILPAEGTGLIRGKRSKTTVMGKGKKRKIDDSDEDEDSEESDDKSTNLKSKPRKKIVVKPKTESTTRHESGSLSPPPAPGEKRAKIERIAKTVPSKVSTNVIISVGESSGHIQRKSKRVASLLNKN